MKVGKKYQFFLGVERGVSDFKKAYKKLME